MTQEDGRGKEGNGFQSRRSSPLFLQPKHSPVPLYKEVEVLLHPYYMETSSQLQTSTALSLGKESW